MSETMARENNVSHLFPADRQESRGGFVVMQWRQQWWSVEHTAPSGGCRTLYRSNWTNEALRRTEQEAQRLGARAIFLEDVYK